MTTESASERLSEALADAEHRGDRVPCAGDDAWLSEVHAERVGAAKRCAPCPVSALCHAAALEERPTWTVRAGVDWGDKAQRRAAMRAGAA